MHTNIANDANLILNPSGGNIGIGVTTPTSALHVNATSAGDGGTNNGLGSALYIKQNTVWSGLQPWALYVADGGYTYLSGFRVESPGGLRSLMAVDSTKAIGFATSGDQPITFTQSQATERMRIATGGNVGIGTSAPGRRLEVANAIVGGANDILRVNNTSAGATDQVRLTLTRAADTGTGVARGMVFFGTSGASGWADYESRALVFYTGAGAAATEKFRLSAAGGLSLGNGYVATDAGAGNLIVQGGVGIGITAPGSYDLNVAGTSLFSDDVTLNKTGGAVLYIAPSGSGSATLSMLSNTGGYSIINADGVADILKLQTAAADRLTIIANGNVGIGTTAPAAKLMVVANSAGDGFISAAGAATYSPQFSLNNTTTQLGAMGLALSSAHFSGVALANDVVIRATAASSNGNLIITNQNGTGDIKFATGSTNSNDTVKMLISNNGNVGIGSSTPSQKLAVNGNVAAIAFIYTSDRNMKKNIKTLDNSLEKILKLRGVSFNWKENNEESLGLIAQEVERVYPELVTTSVGGKGVQYGNLVAPLIEAVKEQQKEIDMLEARIKTLEVKNKRK